MEEEQMHQEEEEQQEEFDPNSCCYCGCTERDKLIVISSEDPDKKYIVCNGKTGKSKSHALALLKHLKATKVCPFDNEDSPFQCSNCGNSNPYELYYNPQTQKFICIHEAQENPEQLLNSLPFISNGQFCTQVVPIPTNPITINLERVKTILDELKKANNYQRPTPLKSPNPTSLIGLTGPNGEAIDPVTEYCRIMKEFLEHEETSEQSQRQIKTYNAELQRKKVSANESQTPNENDVQEHQTQTEQNENDEQEPTRDTDTKYTYYITNCSSLYRDCPKCTKVSVSAKGMNSIEYWNISKIKKGKMLQVNTKTHIRPGPISVKLTFSKITFTRRYDAISEFAKYFSDQERPRNQKIIHYLPLFYGDVDRFNQKNNANLSKRQLSQVDRGSLTNRQRDSIKFALSHKFSAIEGPPGTGKSTIIVQLVKNYLQMGRKPILIESVTNIAANHVAALLKQSENIKVYRLISDTYYDYEIGTPTNNFIKDICVKTLYKRKSKRKKVNIHADVIVTTTSKSASINYKKWKFQALIYDEGSVCLDTDMLISCVKGIPRVTIFGDTKQLPPFVQSQKSKRLGYSKSFMAKLSNDFHIESFSLVTQFRMHPKLSNIVSQLFYDNRLQTQIPNNVDINEHYINYPNPSIPLVVWNTPNAKESFASNGKSMKNYHELYKLVQVIKEAYEVVDPNDIGVITFYSEQKEIIENEFEYWAGDSPGLINFFNDIEVSTVDGFQGREKKHIILSMVRTHKDHIGFLNDYQRACVALSRMKCSLFVIAQVDAFTDYNPNTNPNTTTNQNANNNANHEGNPAPIEDHASPWKKFFNICKEKGVIYNGNDLTRLSLS